MPNQVNRRDFIKEFSLSLAALALLESEGAMVVAPATRYAHSGDARIAFQITGEGPPDLVFIGGPASHLDLQWENPQVTFCLWTVHGK